MTDTPTEKPELILPEEDKVWSITIVDPNGKTIEAKIDAMMIDRTSGDKAATIATEVQGLVDRLLDA